MARGGTRRSLAASRGHIGGETGRGGRLACPLKGGAGRRAPGAAAWDMAASAVRSDGDDIQVNQVTEPLSRVDREGGNVGEKGGQRWWVAPAGREQRNITSPGSGGRVSLY